MIMGTPRQVQSIAWGQKSFSLYGYPWMAQFKGAAPEGFEPSFTAGQDGRVWPDGGGIHVSDSAIVDTAFQRPGTYEGGLYLSGTVQLNGDDDRHDMRQDHPI